MEEIEEKKVLIQTPEKEHQWTIGGPVGSRTAVLLFRCSALSHPPAAPPGELLHMTYKTHQAETKLLTAVLTAHGLREVRHFIYACLC